MDHLFPLCFRPPHGLRTALSSFIDKPKSFLYRFDCSLFQPGPKQFGIPRVIYYTLYLIFQINKLIYNPNPTPLRRSPTLAIPHRWFLFVNYQIIGLQEYSTSILPHFPPRPLKRTSHRAASLKEPERRNPSPSPWKLSSIAKRFKYPGFNSSQTWLSISPSRLPQQKLSWDYTSVCTSPTLSVQMN